ncbi:MAG: GH1 family beta-glucosidase [Kiritimatiellia bacterium]
MTFPHNFVWGAATAAYQIEGAANQDGKGPSIWDVFAHTPGKTYGGQHGDVACDHYNRYRQDVALMKQIGLRAYRFSIAWPRVIPDGTGAPNPAGLDFYDRLVDELLKNGIEPFATVFHWDYPYALYRRGGWLNRDSADWFADYAGLLVSRLGDRVANWMTFNEPANIINHGHARGVKAPGLCLPVSEQLLAAHHILLAHGKAVSRMRASSPQALQIGMAPNAQFCYPDTDEAHVVEVARRCSFDMRFSAAWCLQWWLDPVVFGRYPADGLAQFAAEMPAGLEDDMPVIAQKLDFCGINIYSGREITLDHQQAPAPVAQPVGAAQTAMNWPITPRVMRYGPRFMHERYGLPLYITENGLANTDWPALDGAVHDPQRIDFMQRYLSELEQGIREGADVRGYFHWSLMDNFEWAHGYRERFGLIYVDYSNQRRILKDSAHWYAGVVARNGLPGDCG